MPFGIPDHYHLILASASPRRQQLLREAGLTFSILNRDFDETYPDNLQANSIAEYLAESKALQIGKEAIKNDEIIITADTVVWYKDRVLSKPQEYKEAFKILQLISGNSHEVITGISLMSNSGIHTFSETTKVTFGVLPAEDIDYYIKKYEPYDKAGAYGIQEWIGLIGCSRISGSFFNVMGLPVRMLLIELGEFIKKQNIKM
jgi:septum formation protein